jgi:hypothetical protein
MSAWFGTTWFGRWFGVWFGDRGGPIVLADPDPVCLRVVPSAVALAVVPADVNLRVADNGVQLIIVRGPCGC